MMGKPVWILSPFMKFRARIRFIEAIERGSSFSFVLLEGTVDECFSYPSAYAV
jgi:hypothetical protein